jgi:circadian clock protein KaiC
VRLFDYLKTKQITALVTSLMTDDQTDVGISSLIDTWLQVRDIEIAGERTRGLFLVKSRGMGHSNQVREFVITSRGIDLVPVAVGPNGVLTGSARLTLEAEQRAQAIARGRDAERRRRQLERKRKSLEAQIEAMRGELAAEEEESLTLTEEAQDVERRMLETQGGIARSRSAARGRERARS